MARNYWKISPGEGARLWPLWRRCGYAGVGWKPITNLRKWKTEEEYLKWIEKSGFGTKNSGVAKYCWRFSNQEGRDDWVKPGDVVVAARKLNAVVGMGIITSDYIPGDDPDSPAISGLRKLAEQADDGDEELRSCLDEVAWDHDEDPADFATWSDLAEALLAKESDIYHHCRRVDWQIVQELDLGTDIFTKAGLYELKPEKQKRERIKQAYWDKFEGHEDLRHTLDELFPGIEPTRNSGGNRGRTRNMDTRAVLKQFGQIILYGPPGTGKTREATRRALEVLSGKRPSENETHDAIQGKLDRYRQSQHFELVVFHPAYEYEQFIGGIEPSEGDGKFVTSPGVLLSLCRAAERHKDPVVLVIDEINRGNLPKLLGELVYALEYRDHKVSLPFTFDGSKELTIPKNLYIIATMNSADRSIGHIDVAIRRRFGLVHMGPEREVVQTVWAKNGDSDYGRQLADLMDQVNNVLRASDDLNAEVEHAVGHSYFLPSPGSSGEAAKKDVERKWKHQVKPLLREYAELLNKSVDLADLLNKELGEVLPE